MLMSTLTTFTKKELGREPIFNQIIKDQQESEAIPTLIQRKDIMVMEMPKIKDMEEGAPNFGKRNLEKAEEIEEEDYPRNNIIIEQ